MHYSATFNIFVMDEKRKYRRVVFYKDYFEKFFVKQDVKVKSKIIWILELIEEHERVPERYLKHIAATKGLYEIRLKHGRINIRVFCFFYRNKLIVLANAFHKKAGKTPNEQIKQAIRIKKEYEEEKQQYHYP